MKKFITILSLLIFFANSVQAEDFTQSFNNFCKNLFNPKTQIKQETQTDNNNDDKPSLSADAMILYNANDIEEALKILESIPKDDRTALDWLLIGNIYQDKKDSDKAATFYKQSTLTDTKFYRGYYNLANLYLEEENLQEAINLYKLAIKYKPDFGYAHYNLGCAYVKLGNLKKAKNSFLKSAQYKKDLPEIYYNLAFVYKELNNNKKAEEYLKIYNELTARKM